MKLTEKLSLIEELSNAMGAPGFEEEVNEVIGKYACDFNYETDVLKNAYINLNKDSDNLVMLDAHSDEVGFIAVSYTHLHLAYVVQPLKDQAMHLKRQNLLFPL